MPRPNPQRRRDLADAVVALVAAEGVRGVTHRAVDAAAHVPAGTASNYFPTHDGLLVAAAERIVELQLEDMDTGSSPTPEGVDARDHLADVLAGGLLTAATTHRARYLAIFALQLEAPRRPAVAEALAGLAATARAFTSALHDDRGYDVPASAVGTLIGLYGGALFTLVTGPPVDAEAVRELARGMVRAALTDG